MLKPLHERIEGFSISRAGGELLEPGTKGRVKRGALGLGDETSPFDEVFVGAEG